MLDKRSHTDEMFMALSEPRRRVIVQMLAKNGKMSAGDISKRFSVSSAAISQHLKVLKAAELVNVEKQAQRRIYELNSERLDDLERWISGLKEKWEERFELIDKLLANKNNKLEAK